MYIINERMLKMRPENLDLGPSLNNLVTLEKSIVINQTKET